MTPAPGAPVPRSRQCSGAPLKIEASRLDGMTPKHVTKWTTHYRDSKNSRGGRAGAGPPLME